MPNEQDNVTTQDLKNAAYVYLKGLRTPWYRNSKDLITLLCTVIAVIVSTVGLFASKDAKKEANTATIASTDIERQLNVKTFNEAGSKEKFFVYKSTYFEGQKEKAAEDYKRTNEMLQNEGIPKKAYLYERDDKKRWAVAIGMPIDKKAADDLINELFKNHSIKTYPNKSENWAILQVK